MYLVPVDITVTNRDRPDTGNCVLLGERQLLNHLSLVSVCGIKIVAVIEISVCVLDQLFYCRTTPAVGCDLQQLLESFEIKIHYVSLTQYLLF